MTWLKLISKESGIPVSRIAMWSAAAGACRSGILGTIISALNVIDDEEKAIQHLFLFILLAVGYYALHNFEEDVKESLGQESLYNESLGTVSTFYIYDRVKDRDAGVPKRVWE